MTWRRASADPEQGLTGVIAAAASTLTKSLGTVEQQRWGGTLFETLFELRGGSASARLMPSGRRQHGEFSEDEGVFEEPGNGTILY